MARPKKDARKKKPAKPPADRVAIIHLKGSPEMAAWLEEAYRKTHIAKATLVRLGLKAVAKEYNLPEPPEM